MAAAIQTLYKGIKFRSRTEAKWAVFFDHLNIPYRYELEGYEKNGKAYLPDFFLEDQNCFVEGHFYQPNFRLSLA